MLMDDTLDPLDELVSAYLDDEVTPAERARVETDPELLARVTALRAVSDQVRAVEPVLAGDRDDAVAAALAAFELPLTVTPPVLAPPVPVPADELAERRVVRERRASRSWRWVGAAAAVAALGVGVGQLDFGGADLDTAADMAADTSDDQSVAAAAEARTDAGSAETTAKDGETISEIGGAADVEMAESGDAADTTTAAASAEEDDAVATFSVAVPVLATDDELRTYARSAVEAQRGAGAETSAPPAAVEPGGVGACPDLTWAVLGPVVWQGVDGVAYVVPDLAAPTDVLVVGTDCMVLVQLTLD